MSSLSTRTVPVALVVAATLAVSPAAGAAPSWTPPTVLGAAAGDMGTPDVAVAPSGEAIAAWVGIRPKRVLVSSRRPGKGWSRPVALAPVWEEVGALHLAVSARKAVIVWADTIHSRRGEARVVFAATRIRGKRWSSPRNISAEKRWYREPWGSEPQVAMTPRGKAVVVWQAENEKHPAVSFIASATQAAGRADWTAPIGIRGSAEGEAPQVGMTEAGEAVAIWGASYNEESNINVSSRPPKGEWKAAGQLGTPGPFPQPQLAMTARGEAVGAWVKSPEGGLESKVQVATHTPGGKWRVKTLPQDYGVSPEIVTEPGGRATIVWGNFVSFFGSSEEHEVVSSTHVPGGGWSEPRSLAAEGLHHIAPPSIAVTRGGESIALWEADSPTGEPTTILSSSRRRPQPWSEPQQVSTSRCGDLYETLDLALAPDGKAFAVWQCSNGNRWVIKAAARPAAGPTG